MWRSRVTLSGPSTKHHQRSRLQREQRTKQELTQEAYYRIQTRYGLVIRPLSLIERAPIVLTVPLKVPEPLDSGLALEASIENPPSATSVVVSAVPHTLPNALSVCVNPAIFPLAATERVITPNAGAQASTSEPVVTAAFSSTVTKRLALPFPNPPERPSPVTLRHLQLPGSPQIVSYESIPFFASVTGGQASEV